MVVETCLHAEQTTHGSNMFMRRIACRSCKAVLFTLSKDASCDLVKIEMQKILDAANAAADADAGVDADNVAVMTAVIGHG